MTYQLSPSETPDDGLRRIVAEELSAGIAEASLRDVDLDEVIHEERKHCKRIRGVLALFRGSLADRRTHDRRYRDIARRLAGARDAAAVLEGFSAALDEYPDSRGSETEEVLQALTRRREEAVSRLDDERSGLDRLILDFESARESIPDLVVEADDWPAVAGGLKHWYRRGRRSWQRLQDGGTAAEFHKWRKSAKYHLYHMTLLEDLDPSWMRDRQLAVDRVQELLGQGQDLAVLEELLPDLDLRPEARAVAGKLARRLQERLQLDALRLGQEVYAPKPKRLVKRVKKRWRRWYSPVPEVGQ
jgi:CHAD domain-containing protein